MHLKVLSACQATGGGDHPLTVTPWGVRLRQFAPIHGKLKHDCISVVSSTVTIQSRGFVHGPLTHSCATYRCPDSHPTPPPPLIGEVYCLTMSRTSLYLMQDRLGNGTAVPWVITLSKELRSHLSMAAWRMDVHGVKGQC